MRDVIVGYFNHRNKHRVKTTISNIGEILNKSNLIQYPWIHTTQELNLVLNASLN